MQRLITASLLIIAIIHLLPLAGFLSLNQLNSLYSVTIEDNNLEILMRHRAVLFGILGALFAYAAFVPSIQPIAFIAAFASIGSFFYLAFSVGAYNNALQRVVNADIVAAICLVIGIVLYFFERS